MNTKRVLLLGTSHSVQMGVKTAAAEDIEAFKQGVKRLCEEHAAKGIAEEMSLEALAKWKSSPDTVAKKTALGLGLPHLYCDPTRQERSEICADAPEMRQDARKLLGLPELTDAELESLERTAFDRREHEWLRRLQALDVWPILFICGSDHLPSFTEKATRAGIDVLHVGI